MGTAADADELTLRGAASEGNGPTRVCDESCALTAAWPGGEYECKVGGDKRRTWKRPGAIEKAQRAGGPAGGNRARASDFAKAARRVQDRRAGTDGLVPTESAARAVH